MDQLRVSLCQTLQRSFGAAGMTLEAQTLITQEVDRFIQLAKARKILEDDVEHLQARVRALLLHESPQYGSHSLLTSVAHKRFINMQNFKADVDAQLRERQQKTATAEAIRRKEAEDTINTAAWEIRHDLEEEEEEQRAAKGQLQEFLSGNAEVRLAKARAREAQQAADLIHLAQTSPMEASQMAAKRQQLAKVAERQARQEAAARVPIIPNTRRMVNDATMDRYRRDKEEADMREQVRRKAVVADRARETQAAIADQIREKAAKQKAAADLARQEADATAQRVQEWKLQEHSKEQQARQKNQEFRRLLEQQIKDNAKLRTKQPMSEVEKRINSNLLQQIQESGIKVATI
ncbi:hypothetical protein WJX74_005081 [Apatococcus lobatus]|uniref:Uncharacterized protein n=1 Tax=Apatococcus lobatus TaxID=904363 RepID=A0AAW1RZZ5_9CHLO